MKRDAAVATAELFATDCMGPTLQCEKGKSTLVYIPSVELISN